MKYYYIINIIMTQEAFNKEIDTIYKEYLHTDIFCLVDALHIIEKYGIYSDVNKKRVLKQYNTNICPAFITFFCDKYGFIQQYDSIKIDYETQINKLNQTIESHLIKEKEYINRIIDLDLAKSAKQVLINNDIQKEFVEKPRAIKSTFFDSQWSRMSQSSNKNILEENDRLKKREKELLEKINILENKIKSAVSACDNIIE